MRFYVDREDVQQQYCNSDQNLHGKSGASPCWPLSALTSLDTLSVECADTNEAPPLPSATASKVNGILQMSAHADDQTAGA